LNARRVEIYFSGWKDYPNGQKRGDETFRGISFPRDLCKKPGLTKHPFSFFNLLFAFKSDWEMMPGNQFNENGVPNILQNGGNYPKFKVSAPNRWEDHEPTGMAKGRT
jgi:hypothetical protein